MSIPASTTAELAPAAPAAPPAASREPDAVEYPTGQWIAQGIRHGAAVRLATAALDLHFLDREDVLVAMELVVYYRRGDKEARLRPDVQVVFGVPRGGDRGTYKVWEEGKAPDFVLEVASPTTADNDAGHKAREYARIGVREYWRLDPKGSLMARPLEGYEASGGRWRPVAEAGRGGRYLRSRVLGLELRSATKHGATVLVFRNPRTGEEFDGGLEEAERRRRAAEKRARAAETRASAAETRSKAAEERASAAVSQARQEARLKRAAEERVRALEERLRNLAPRTPQPRRDFQP